MRRRGRPERASWTPVALLIGLIVVAGIVLWVLLTSDDEALGALLGSFALWAARTGAGPIG